MPAVLVAPEIFSSFPATRIGVLVLDNLQNAGEHPALTSMLRAEEAIQREKLAPVELPSLPELKVWREAYKRFGSDPRDFRPSVEALLRRTRGGTKPLPLINPLVDLYNYISIKYHVPVGAEDLAKIHGDVKLQFAAGDESGLALGAEAPENCYPGEVIYRDDVSFLCRRWNWREADRTKIEKATTRAILVIDTVGGIGPEVLARALDETAELIRRELKADIKGGILEPASPALSYAI